MVKTKYGKVRLIPRKDRPALYKPSFTGLKNLHLDLLENKDKLHKNAAISVYKKEKVIQTDEPTRINYTPYSDHEVGQNASAKLVDERQDDEYGYVSHYEGREDVPDDMEGSTEELVFNFEENKYEKSTKITDYYSDHRHPGEDEFERFEGKRSEERSSSTKPIDDRDHDRDHHHHRDDDDVRTSYDHSYNEEDHNYDDSPKPEEDGPYAGMTAEEIMEDKRTELKWEYRLLAKKFERYVDIKIPKYNPNLPYSESKDIFEKCQKEIRIEQRLISYKNYLKLGFSFAEYGMREYLGITLEGLADFHESQMDMYHPYLVDISYNANDTFFSSLPVEVRLVGVILIQTMLLYILTKGDAKEIRKLTQKNREERDMNLAPKGVDVQNNAFESMNSRGPPKTSRVMRGPRTYD